MRKMMKNQMAASTANMPTLIVDSNGDAGPLRCVI